MQKKDKTPFILKLVRWFFPKLEVVAPFLAHRYFLRIFFTPLRYPVPEKERVAESFADKFELRVSGKRVQGYAWGKGDAYVLLLHGWAGRATQLRRFIKPLLAAGFKVIAVDGPAHGQSEGNRTTILEFEETLNLLVKKFGTPESVIAHSFGGVATLYSIMNGMPLKKLVMIASPTIGDEVIKTYLRAINGSWKTGEYFKRYMKKRFGKTFDEFSGLHFIKHLPHPIDLLLVYDDNDKEVDVKHAEALLELYPQAHLIRTKKLGHTRILKDDAVIRKCVTFVKDGSSVNALGR